MNVSFDTNKLFYLLKDFHLVTNLRVGIYDCSFTEVIAYPVHHSGFCKIIRSKEIGLKRCMLCDSDAFAYAREHDGVYIYHCHAGLTEAIAPIRSQDETIGYLMFGQMRSEENTNRQWQNLKSSFASVGFDVEYLESAFYKLHGLGTKKITAYARILQACAVYVWMSGYVMVRRGDLPEKLDKYITSHLDSPLTLKNISAQIGLGKTTLCNCAKQQFGMTVGEMIKKRRIEKAKELLKQTDLSIASIAVQVGVPDYNYFSKLFKSVAGQSPTSYRTQYSKQF